MSIYRRKSGRWQAVTERDCGDSARQRKSLGTFATRKEAERAEREALATKDRGIDLDPQDVTLTDVATRFLRDAKPDLAPATHARYEEMWEIHVAQALGAKPIAKIKPAHVLDLYARLRTEKIPYKRRNKDGTLKNEVFRYGKPLSANSVRHVHRFLKRLYSWAESVELTSRNVMRMVKPPKPTPSPAKTFSLDQALAFLETVKDSPLAPFFAVAMHTGLRRGELGALQWEAVDFQRRIIIVRQAIGGDRRGNTFTKPTKSGKVREVPLNPQALAALGRQKARIAADKLAAEEGEYADKGFVFCEKDGTLLDLDAASKMFSVVAKQAGIWSKGITLHSCRHFFATQALVNGADLHGVQAMLGHESPTTTLALYGHLLDGAKERAAATVSEAFQRAQARRAIGKN